MDDADEPPPWLGLRKLRVGDQGVPLLSYPLDAPKLLREAGSLTAAEAAVAALARSGLSNAEIAEARGTSVRTVPNQMASILRRLGVRSRHELAVASVRGELAPR